MPQEGAMATEKDERILGTGEGGRKEISYIWAFTGWGLGPHSTSSLTLVS